ncbi:MAG: alpha/beta fold hydrolase [Alphaproteobacteria bacterium]|nr:alpha/beta fold hydrolase [Alphaproteobacteria bacterium]
MTTRRALLAGGVVAGAALVAQPRWKFFEGLADSVTANSGTPVAIPSGPPPVPKPRPPIAEPRMVDIPGGYKVWTQAVGEGDTNVLLLHGGPGFSHDYLEAFTDYVPQSGLQIIYYDQLGCGKSDKPTDRSLWTLERYLQEVEAVRTALGLENFVLYGHSWGGILAIEYALRYGRNLSRLVISNMTASIPAYVMYATQIRSQLPRKDQQTLAHYEALSRTDAPAYQKILDRIYAEHVLRMQPWPEPVQRAFGGANMEIYNTMQGPNEFVITGNLKDWNRWQQLHDITVPTLIMGAKHDEMDPAQITQEAKIIPGAKLWISEKGSHLAMWDDQEAYFARLMPFLMGEG